MRALFLFLLLAAVVLPTWSIPTQDDEIILGRHSPIQSPQGDEPTRIFDSGSQIRQQPSFDSPVVEILKTAVELPVLDQRGPWFKIRFGSWQGWVNVGDTRPRSESLASQSFDPDDERLQRARSLLDSTVEPTKLGPFTLFTDVSDPDLLGWLAVVAADVPRAYRERFGLDPQLMNREIVVLFNHESDYREFVAAEARVAGTESRGYTSEGLSVLFLGDHDKTSLVSVFIHELAHLLNRKVFRSANPPWLEEGLAEDLAFCQVSRRGEIQLGTLAGDSAQGLVGSYSDSEPRAHVAALVDNWAKPSRPDLTTLINLSWEDFVRPENRAIHYAQSALLIRYLLDGAEKATQQRFRRYLLEASQADLPDSISMWESLDVGPHEVEAELYRFLLLQARAHGL